MNSAADLGTILGEQEAMTTVFLHDGVRYVDPSRAFLEHIGVPPDAVLTSLKTAGKFKVDTLAEEVRLRFLTPGTGQAMEYAEVQAQAEAALSAKATTVKPEAYPMLAASIGLDVDPDTGRLAEDVLGVARGIRAARASWLDVGSQIRRVRQQAKADIEAATSREAIEMIVSAIVWPAP